MSHFETLRVVDEVTNMSAAELSYFRTRSVCFLDTLMDMLRNKSLEFTEEVALSSG